MDPTRTPGALPPTFQDVIMNLQRFWADTGCIVLEPYDTEVGAGTNAPATTLRALGPKTWRTAYVQGCRRPTDGRYGENPNRLQFYYQFQVLIKPSPDNIQDLYLRSLEAIGIDTAAHDVRFVEDDWESPTLGAWGLGWEVWIDGMEVTQFTYFQQVGGFECSPVPVEIAYGLERLTMFVQGVDSVYDIVWSRGADGIVFTYGDVYLENEREFSRYNFEVADTERLFELFAAYERECQETLEAGLPLPAYDCVLKCSHTFNLLDARGVISATERMAYILRVRDLAKACCESYLELVAGVSDETAEEAAAGNAESASWDTPAVLGTQTLAFEIGTEEIPAFDLVKATDQLATLVPNALDAARIPHGEVHIYSTPRRLIAMVDDVAGSTEAVEEVFRGPKAAIAFDEAGAPTKAAIGFARGKGLAVEDLSRREEGGVEYVFASRRLEAIDVRTLLPEALRSIIDGINWRKSCRWGRTREWFSRPVRWIVALFGDEVIPLHYANIESGRETYAHRFLAPGPHEVAAADDLLTTLRKCSVIPSYEERRDLILEGVKAAEAAYGATAELPDKTLTEVINLGEYPTVLVGTFDEEFLAVPPEIIVDAMLMHQRYFPLYDANHKLTNHFIVVSNGDPAQGAVITEGNERVVAARLYDAKFFYDEDLKKPLEAYVDHLDELVFHADLGTVAAKTARVRALAAFMASDAALADEERQSVVRAAELAKADLVTSAVIEFTSVQGIMGSYYALASGESELVAEAIADHYRPRFSGDALPRSVVGKYVAVADKLDTICALFAVGQPPTSTKDPFALRRSALGVIAILESGLPVSLGSAVDESLEILAAEGVAFNREETRDAILEFFTTRTSVLLRDEGIRADTISAVLGVDVEEPAEIIARCRALEAARVDDETTFQSLAVAFARANNLRDGALGVECDETLFVAEERRLADAIEAADDAVKGALGNDDYGQALEALAGLRAPIDAFFDAVLVMDEDASIRENRLRLLNRFVRVFAHVADFGLMATK